MPSEELESDSTYVDLESGMDVLRKYAESGDFKTDVFMLISLIRGHIRKAKENISNIEKEVNTLEIPLKMHYTEGKIDELEKYKKGIIPMRKDDADNLTRLISGKLKNLENGGANTSDLRKRFDAIQQIPL